MKYLPTTPASSRRRATRTIRSEDGVVSFVLGTSGKGLLVERTQLRGGRARAVQLTVFTDDESFRRWCDADSMRFDYPLVYMALRRDGDAFLRGGK
jgi:hypothetical protein